MLTVGELCRITETTRDTVIHYDNVGLLKPSYVDPETHYRYYSEKQADILKFIVFCRRMEMPVAMVRELLDSLNNPDSYIELIKKHIQAIRKKINRYTDILATLNDILDFYNGTAGDKISKTNEYAIEHLGKTKPGAK